MRTFLPQAHFHFKGFEIIGHTGLDFPSHALAGPLLEAVNFLVDVHDRDGTFDEVVRRTDRQIARDVELSNQW